MGSTSCNFFPQIFSAQKFGNEFGYRLAALVLTLLVWQPIESPVPGTLYTAHCLRTQHNSPIKQTISSCSRQTVLTKVDKMKNLVAGKVWVSGFKCLLSCSERIIHQILSDGFVRRGLGFVTRGTCQSPQQLGFRRVNKLLHMRVQLIHCIL